MSRCQHCNKLTHAEHLYVEYDAKDQEKVYEFTVLEAWTHAYMYSPGDPTEYGKLKVGDIYIHFKIKLERKDG